jgi:hypothetical protein
LWVIIPDFCRLKHPLSLIAEMRFVWFRRKTPCSPDIFHCMNEKLYCCPCYFRVKKYVFFSCKFESYFLNSPAFHSKLWYELKRTWILHLQSNFLRILFIFMVGHVSCGIMLIFVWKSLFTYESSIVCFFSFFFFLVFHFWSFWNQLGLYGIFSLPNLLELGENCVSGIITSTHLRSVDKRKTFISCIIAFIVDWLDWVIFFYFTIFVSDLKTSLSLRIISFLHLNKHQNWNYKDVDCT